MRDLNQLCGNASEPRFGKTFVDPVPKPFDRVHDLLAIQLAVMQGRSHAPEVRAGARQLHARGDGYNVNAYANTDGVPP